MKYCPSLLLFIIIKGRVLFPYWGFETVESHPNLFPSSQKHSSVVCGKNHSPAQSSLAAGWGEQAAEAGAGWGWKIPPRLHCPCWPEAAARAAGCGRSQDPPQFHGRLPVGLSEPHQAVFAHCLSARNPCPPPCCTAGGRDAGSTQAGRGMQPSPGCPSSVVSIICRCHGPPSPRSAPAGGESGWHRGAAPVLALPAPARLHPAVLSRAGLQRGAGMEGWRLGEFLRCPWGLPFAEHPQTPHLQPPSTRR